MGFCMSDTVLENIDIDSDVTSVSFDNGDRKVAGSKWYVLQVYSG